MPPKISTQVNVAIVPRQALQNHASSICRHVGSRLSTTPSQAPIWRGSS